MQDRHHAVAKVGAALGKQREASDQEHAGPSRANRRQLNQLRNVQRVHLKRRASGDG
jgi:hypothetical protein